MQAIGLRSDKRWEMQAGGLRLNIAKYELGLEGEDLETQGIRNRQRKYNHY